MEHSELVTTVGLGCVPRDGWGQGVYGGGQPGKCSTHMSTYMGLEARLVSWGPFLVKALGAPDTPF